MISSNVLSSFKGQKEETFSFSYCPYSQCLRNTISLPQPLIRTFFVAIIKSGAKMIVLSTIGILKIVSFDHSVLWKKQGGKR